MNIVDDFLDNPKRSIGGAVIPIIGTPGSGKTNVLIQLALMRKKEGHKILWRGTEQGEWIKFLANDQEVTVWNHENIETVDVKISSRHQVDRKKLEEIEGIHVREWSDPEKVVEQSSQDRINVVNVPGLFGNGKKGRAYFSEKVIDVLEQIIRRENTYNFVDFFTDEAGDIWPCQQQLNGDQYQQVAERTPPLLSQLRKQNAFMYCAAHGTQDMHYFVWKIKANTICYMSNSKVKNFHSEISQKSVNRLDRGQMWVPPKDLTKYALAYEEEDLEWVGDGQHVDLDIQDSLETELEEEEEEDGNPNPQTVKNAAKKTIAKNLYEDEDEDFTQKELADKLGMSKRDVNEAVA